MVVGRHSRQAFVSQGPPSGQAVLPAPDHLALNEEKISIYIPPVLGYGPAFESAVSAAKSDNLDPLQTSWDDPCGPSSYYICTDVA